MATSLLNHLPDILRQASKRSREVLRESAMAPHPLTQASVNPFSPAGCRTDLQATPRSPNPNSRDIPAMLDLLMGNEHRPSMRGRVGFVWLSPEAPDDTDIPAQCELHAAGTSWELGDGPALDRDLLCHLTLRMLIVRDLLSPAALIAVSPVARLGDCTALLMEAVTGHRPFWTCLRPGDHANRMLVCKTDPAGHPPTERAAAQRPVGAVSEMLSQIEMGGQTAVALQPARDIVNLLAAWNGSWFITHADPTFLAHLHQRHCAGQGQADPKPPRGGKKPFGRSSLSAAIDIGR